MWTEFADLGVVPAGGGAKAAPDPVLDLRHLRRFTLGDASLEQEILRLFAESTPLIISQLRNAGSEKAWRDAVHTLKGTAGAVGARRLASVAAEAERGLCESSEWPSSLAKLETALAATLGAIDPLIVGSWTGKA